jgi:uncharacterized OB-fold protein
MTTTARVLPLFDHDTRPYFEAAARHELRIQRCRACKTILHLPRPMCYVCRSMETEWIPAGPRGRVYSWTVVTHPVHPAFAVPYVVALVELEEPPGVRLVTNLRDCEPAAIRESMPVELFFEDLADGVSLPQFRPAGLAAVNVDGSEP